MSLKYSIHDIFKIKVSDPPDRIKTFLNREFNYFKVDEIDEVDLDIRFVDNIEIPEKSVCLMDGFFYKEGYFYFDFSGSILCFPIKDISSKNMVVLSEKNVPEWMIFYSIEKVLHIKVIEKGFCFLHAGGVKENGKTTVFSSLQRGGKTKWALEKLEDGAGYLGDDLVLFDRTGDAYTYPRGININRYHGRSYRRFIRNLPFATLIRNRLSIMALSLLHFLFSFSSVFKKRIEGMINARSIFRINVGDFFSNVEIINKSKLDEIIISLRANCKEPSYETWSSKKMVNFLHKNLEYERAAHVRQYMGIFWVYGDEYSFAIKKYFAKLMKKEIMTLYRLIGHADVLVILDKLYK